MSVFEKLNEKIYKNVEEAFVLWWIEEKLKGRDSVRCVESLVAA